MRDSAIRAMYWVIWFDTDRVFHRTATGLCWRGILRPDDVRSWLFFTRRVYGIVDPEPRRRLLERLGECVFGDAAPPDTETGILVALADAGGILRIHFTGKRLRDRQWPSRGNRCGTRRERYRFTSRPEGAAGGGFSRPGGYRITDSCRRPASRFGPERILCRVCGTIHRNAAGDGGECTVRIASV